MKLIAARIQGYRRFEEVEVLLREPLIAVIGQNEAGKSTFLGALMELNSENEIDDSDITRNYDGPVKIEGVFKLNDRSVEEISRVENHDVIDEVRVIKRRNGNISIKLDELPSHDLSSRKEIRERIKDVDQFESINQVAGQNTISEISENVQLLDDILDSKQIEIPYKDLDILQRFGTDLESVYDSVLERDEVSEKYEDELEKLDKIIEDIGTLEQNERNCPSRRARKILRDSIPRFLPFTQEERDLKSTYNLEDLDLSSPPPELRNLLRLAGLDLKSYYDDIENYEPEAQHKLDEANVKLETAFSEIWVRDDVVPYLAKDEYLLHVHVSQEGESGLSRIGERSDGLAWFVALRAFLARKEVNKPVILVDEIETHLSYDAQARLIEYLETEVQELAQKVVYTTHSAGSLPSDVGRGIRSVERVENGGERSTINNGFWTERDAGFSPMLMAMGLSPFAFSIPRNALITEGPSDCILLPELIRESIGEEKLPYQVAPGAAWVDTDTVPELISESANTVLIFDGDSESEQLMKIFREAGVGDDIMRTYDDFVAAKEGLILENLVDFEILVEAINGEINLWEETDAEVEETDIDPEAIWESLEVWCEDKSIEKPRKIGIAQRLINMSMGENGRTIVSNDNQVLLEELHEWALDNFHIPS